MLYRVYNQGDIPRLGHGWRSVIALTRGRKWITVIDWSTLECARLEVKAWQKLNPQPDSCMNTRKVRTLMRRRQKYAQRSRTVQAALDALLRAAP